MILVPNSIMWRFWSRSPSPRRYSGQVLDGCCEKMFDCLEQCFCCLCKCWLSQDHFLYPVHDTSKIVLYQGPWIMTEITCQSWSVVIGVVTSTLGDDDKGTKYALMSLLLFMNLTQVIFILRFCKPCNFERVNNILFVRTSLDSWSSFTGLFAIAFPGHVAVAIMWLVGTIAGSIFSHCYMKKSAAAAAKAILKENQSQIIALGQFFSCADSVLPVDVENVIAELKDDDSVYGYWMELNETAEHVQGQVAQVQEAGAQAQEAREQVQETREQLSQSVSEVQDFASNFAANPLGTLFSVAPSSPGRSPR